MELLGQGPPDFSVAPKSMSFSFGLASEPLPFSYFGEVGESTLWGGGLSISYVCESENRDCKEANALDTYCVPGGPSFNPMMKKAAFIQFYRYRK